MQKKMIYPNFFIVGAPKCGTTALASYLRDHPDVFLCDPKEPHYFANDMDAHRYVRSEEAYLALFRHAKEHHHAIGEASVGYLFSTVALANIRAFNPDARIIAMVRNPVDMAQSLHRQLVYAGYEDEPDFEKAWRLQALRREGEAIPVLCRAPAFLQYGEACSLGKQIKHLYAVFPREQVHVIVFDDLARDVAGTYRNALAFLGLPPDGRENFETVNEAKSVRFAWLGRWAARLKPAAVRAAVGIKRKTGLDAYGLLKGIEQLNQVKAIKSPVPAHLALELQHYFESDVVLLSSLLGRDLTDWTKTTVSS
ncbi:MAG: sulfotransferase [Pseudomonadota bacterium]